ncbi:hypothetical protein K525DRAFT_280714 [Schizophyllum commune Loenen D]|nr:hypothetical protein K525DRAFT_280714 [Schizophyllum commune Loenen D]
MSASDVDRGWSEEEDVLEDELDSNRSSSGDVEVLSPCEGAKRLVIRLPARRAPPTSALSPQPAPRTSTPPARDPLSVEGIFAGLEPSSSDPELTPIRAYARRPASPTHRHAKRPRSPPSLQESSDDDNPFLLPVTRTLFDVDVTPSEEVVPPKRKRGRPRKDQQAKAATAAAQAPLAVEELNPSIALWVVVEFPPIEEQVARGRKVKTTKVPPKKFGPAKVSTTISFDMFKSIVAKVVMSTVPCLQLLTFSYCLEKAKRSSAYPMTDATQYESMVNQVQQVAPKDRSSTKLLIIMSPPLVPTVVDDVPVWAAGYKAPPPRPRPAPGSVSQALQNLVGGAKNTDERLDLVAAQIKRRWPLGACKAHVKKHCYRRMEGGAEVHFILDPTLLNVWSIKLQRDPKHVTLDIPPSDSQFFDTERATLIAPPSAASSTSLPVPPHGTPTAATPPGPPPPHTPYAAPPYAGYYAPPPHGYYAHTPYTTEPLAPYRPPGHHHHRRHPSPPSSPPPPDMDLDEFCRQYKLSDRIRQALDDAHFRIGQKLTDQYTCTDLPPLTVFEFGDFKAAYKRYRTSAYRPSY